MAKIRSLTTMALGLGLLVAGCAPPETAADFASGQGAAVLDGASISNDGSTFELSMDSERQVLSHVGIDGGIRYIDFDPELSAQLDVPVPTEIGTGTNTLQLDTRTGMATLDVEVPFSGMQTFSFQTGNALSLFGLDQRGTAQQRDEAPDCKKQVASIDEFCTLFERHAPASLEDITALALDYAHDNGISNIADGFIEQTVNDFYDVIADFCVAWTEVRDGSAEHAAVDPCDMQ